MLTPSHQVLSSILAAWLDVNSAVEKASGASSTVVAVSMDLMTDTLRRLNVGYFWMLLNCLTSAAYASFLFGLAICPLTSGVRYC